MPFLKALSQQERAFLFFKQQQEFSMQQKNITIDETIPHINYIADGIQTEFVFPFLIFESSNINVYVNDNLLTEGYTISFENNDTGGSVIFNTAPQKDSVISIIRELSIKRVSDFQEGGEIRSKALNYEFNYQIACTQQIAEALNRSFLLPVYSVNSGLVKDFPQPAANKAIIWNSSGTGLTNSQIEIDKFNNIMENYHTDSRTAAAEAASSAASAASSLGQCQTLTAKAQEQADLAQQASEVTRFMHIGSIIAFDHPASYPGLLPLNDENHATGYLISNCDTGYPDFWTEMLRLKTLSINNPEYEKYSKTQEEYDAELSANTTQENSYCDFYVIDEEQKSVRLPYLGKAEHGICYYIVIANKFENVSEAQFASIQNLIDQKVGESVKTDLSNAMPNIDFVIESWNEGESWYRLYKSGWLEQGGYIWWEEDQTRYVVNLLRPFRDSYYSLLTTFRTPTLCVSLYGSTYGQNETEFKTKSYGRADKTVGVIWRAAGYAAEI